MQIVKQYESRVRATHGLIADYQEIDAKKPTSKVYEAMQHIILTHERCISLLSPLVPGSLVEMQECIDKGILMFVPQTRSQARILCRRMQAGERYRDKLCENGCEVYEYRKSAGKIQVKGKLTLVSLG